MKILKQNKFQTIKVFFEIRMFKIFLLGIISGFPWVLIGSSLSLWLKEEGLSRSTIGWAGAIFAVYAINYLWAPLVDKLKILWLTKKIGHRKSWIFLMQLLIGISLLIWSSIDPEKNLFLIILIGLLIAIFSSTLMTLPFTIEPFSFPITKPIKGSSDNCLIPNEILSRSESMLRIEVSTSSPFL